MKTIAYAAAALVAMTAAPAFAQAAQSGEDGVGTYGITGTAGVFCKLGRISTASVGQGVNTTVNTANGATSDANITITTLADANDRATAWTSVLGLTNTVCNTAYTVSSGSVNGGLLYKGTQSGSTDFTTKLAYTIKVDFGGQTGAARQASSIAGAFFPALTSTKAAAGTMTLTFSGAADASKYLLAGDYNDVVQVLLAANTGTSA